MTETHTRSLPTPFVVLCVAVGALAVAWWALWFTTLGVERSERTTRAYADVDRLRVDGGSGDVEVVGEDRDDVLVIALRTWSLGRPDADHVLEDGVLTLRGGCDGLKAFGPGRCATDFELRVPRALELEVRATSGDVTARDLAGRVALAANSGSVRATGLAGALVASASSGDVTVEGYRGRDVTARASSGDVAVWARSEPRRVEATASSGDVTVGVPGAVPYVVDVDTGSGDERIDLRQSFDAPRRIAARANSGNVTVSSLADGR